MRFKINLRNIDGVKIFVPLVMGFESDIDLCIDRYIVDAKSLLGVLSLSINRDLTLIIHEKNANEAAKIRQILKDNDFLVEG